MFMVCYKHFLLNCVQNFFNEYFVVYSSCLYWFICTAFVDLGLLFVVAGSAEHIMTSIKLFRWSVISPARLLWVCNYTAVIMTVWLFGVSKLIGYKDQLQYLSMSIPRMMNYFDVQRTKPKNSNK